MVYTQQEQEVRVIASLCSERRRSRESSPRGVTSSLLLLYTLLLPAFGRS